MRYFLKTSRYTVAVKNTSLKIQARVMMREYKGKFCPFLFQIQVRQWKGCSRGVN